MTTEVLRNMIYARSPTRSTACATSCSTRCTTCRTAPAARCGRRSSSTSRPRSTSSRSRRPCRTPKRSRRGCRRCGARPRRSSRSAGPVELVHLYLVGDRGAPSLHLLPTFVDDDGELRPNPGRDPARRPQRRRPRAAPAPALQAVADRGRRAARRRADAARDRVRVLAHRLRSGGRAVPRRRACGSPTPTSARALRAIAERHVEALVRRRPRRARLRHVARGHGGGRRRAPRRARAADEGSGRGGVRGRAAEGRVRDRDARRSASTCRRGRSSSRSSRSSRASTTSS